MSQRMIDGSEDHVVARLSRIIAIELHRPPSQGEEMLVLPDECLRLGFKPR